MKSRYTVKIKDETGKTRNKHATSLNTIKGLVATNSNFTIKWLAVRYTHDNIGKTLSIADEQAGVQFSVNYEDLQKIIKEYEDDTGIH